MRRIRLIPRRHSDECDPATCLECLKLNKDAGECYYCDDMSKMMLPSYKTAERGGSYGTLKVRLKPDHQAFMKLLRV